MGWRWAARHAGRPLTSGERRLVADMFGDAIDAGRVRIHCARWFPLHMRRYTMAPNGAIWFHPAGGLYRDDFADAPLTLQGHLLHELTHVWQHQRGINLILRRHPLCRYRYRLVPGRPFARYGLEQQAEIVRHTFLARHGVGGADQPPAPMLEAILPFRGFSGGDAG